MLEKNEMSLVQTYPKIDFFKDWRRAWTYNITPRPPFYGDVVAGLKANMLKAKGKATGPFLELIRGIPPGLVKGRLSKHQILDLEKKMNRFNEAYRVYAACLDAYEEVTYRNMRHRNLVSSKPTHMSVSPQDH